MKKILLAASIFGCIAIQGCDNDKKKTESTDSVTSDQQMSQPVIANTDSAQPVSVSTSTETPVTQNSSSVAAVPTAAGMNPPHGQPNHRCDIAVGAPLNSPPGNNKAANPASPNVNPSLSTSPNTVIQASSMQDQQTIQPTIASPGTTPPGMNPPHGQPGHDCAIAVGAPLKK